MCFLLTKELFGFPSSSGTLMCIAQSIEFLVRVSPLGNSKDFLSFFLLYLESKSIIKISFFSVSF